MNISNPNFSMVHLRTVLGVASPGEAKGVGRGSSSLTQCKLEKWIYTVYILCTYIYIYNICTIYIPLLYIYIYIYTIYIYMYIHYVCMYLCMYVVCTIYYTYVLFIYIYIYMYVYIYICDLDTIYINLQIISLNDMYTL